MGGLALCSANELSFNAAGFAAAMATNLSEWYVGVKFYHFSVDDVFIIVVFSFYSILGKVDQLFNKKKIFSSTLWYPFNVLYIYIQ